MKRFYLFFFGKNECNFEICVQNKILHEILGDKNLEEYFTRLKLEIGHLRNFVSLVYIHVHVEKRMKLEPSREKGVFNGYNESSKDYNIFILVQRKKILNRYVNFKDKLTSRKSHELLPTMIEGEEREAQKVEQYE